MAKFIGPVVDDLVAILKKYTPQTLGGLEPFVDFGKAFTGVVPNFPATWVMPVRTLFDPEGSLVGEQHQLVVKYGVSGSEPDALEVAGVRYMKALDDAIGLAVPGDWQVTPKNVFITEHDYGSLFSHAGGLMAKFPEMHVLVEIEEL